MSNILDKIKLSGVTYDIIDATAVHSLDGYWTSEQTTSAITAATAALAETIGEELNNKADVSAVTADIEAAVSGKADTSAVTAVNDVLTAHTANTDIHVTTSDKEAWNAKADVSDIPSVSGYADSVKFNSTSKYVEFYHGGTGGTVVFSYDASPFLIDGMVQNVEIKDVTISGESVTCLVVSFNTDAGKQDINIPLTEIFDPSNYYTTAQTDSAIEAATSGKADTSAVTAVNDVVTAHTADTTIHVTSNDKETWNAKQNALSAGTGIEISGNVISVTGAPMTVDQTVISGSTNPVAGGAVYDELQGKQATLESGTNIKTVGTNSVLGSGNIPLMTARVGTDDDATTLIFEFN